MRIFLSILLIFGASSRFWLLIGHDKISRPLRAWMWRHEYVPSEDEVRAAMRGEETAAPAPTLAQRVWPKLAWWIECASCGGLAVTLAGTVVFALWGHLPAVMWLYVALTAHLAWVGVWSAVGEIGAWRSLYARRPRT